MRVINLSEVESLEEGESIPAIAGRIKAVYDYKEGNNDKGPWSVQNLILSDGKTDVRIAAWNLYNLEEITGKNVLIESSQSAKHGLTGIKKTIEEWNGKTLHKVKLTGTCKIRQGGENPDDDRIPMEHDNEGRPVIDNALPNNGVQATRKHIMQSVNLYNLCVDAVDSVVKPNIEGMTADFYQAAVGTIFIEASRWGAVDKMPAAPIKKAKLNRAPTQEENEPAPF